MAEMIAAREAYGCELVDLAKQREDFVVLEADLSESTRTCYFAEAFPKRFIDCGIAEMNMMDMAAGMAACGVLPVVNTFSVFSSMKTCEQVRTYICYPDLNVKIVSTHAGLDVGEAGVTHQAIEDVAIMRSFPNMVVLSPCDDIETAAALRAMLEHRGPVYMRLGRSPLPRIHEEDHSFEVGKPEVLRNGADVVLIGTGITVGFALDAADRLKPKGIDAAVVNMATLKPVDGKALLDAVGKSKVLVTVEDHNVIGGLGSAVLEALSEGRPAPVLRLGLQDVFGVSGKPKDLFAKYGLDPEGIARSVEGFLADL
jgi:transketolase